jgi:hypothetical protein
MLKFKNVLKYLKKNNEYRVAYPIKFILKDHVITGGKKSNTTPGGT